MNVLDEWLACVAADLGLDPAAIDRDGVLKLTRDVAHDVARPAAPLTAYLVGLAAGRNGGTREAVGESLASAGRSVKAWTARHPSTGEPSEGAH